MENQRIRLSKKMLKDGLIQLLQQNDIQSIKVQDICQEAQINRTTFYKYYGSQFDLLKDIEKDFFTQMEAYLIPSSSKESNDGLIQALDYIQNERERCLLLFNATSDKSFAEKLFNLPIIRNSTKRSTSQDFSESQMEYFHTFMTYGGYAMILKWLATEDKESSREIAQLLQNIITNFTNR